MGVVVFAWSWFSVKPNSTLWFNDYLGSDSLMHRIILKWVLVPLFMLCCMRWKKLCVWATILFVLFAFDPIPRSLFTKVLFLIFQHQAPWAQWTWYLTIIVLFNKRMDKCSCYCHLSTSLPPLSLSPSPPTLFILDSFLQIFGFVFFGAFQHMRTHNTCMLLYSQLSSRSQYFHIQMLRHVYSNFQCSKAHANHLIECSHINKPQNLFAREMNFLVLPQSAVK